MARPPAITRYGRVIEAAIARFTAECFKDVETPPLGELIAVEDGPETIVAVVSSIVTQGIDPSRRVNAHGGPEDDLPTVLAAHPHVPALLLTTFSGSVVGYLAPDGVRQYLPPAPPPIQARVRACSDEEVREFTGSFDFLRLLLETGPLADEVLAAALRRAAEAYGAAGRAFLVRAGKALSPLLARDPVRLQATLRRMQA